jgi:phosphopantothenoylcysteine decarboxylase / phosphopantothenate---cysteine ligase
MRPRLLVTTGPTREALDPVRFLSNASTGKQGVEIAREATRRGWRVDLVHGPMEAKVPPGVKPHAVRSAAEMLRACRTLHPACQAVVGAAAVSDYRPRIALTHKRKSATKGKKASWVVTLVPTKDILRELVRHKGSRVHVGFALETKDLLRNAGRKLRQKRLDWIVANSVEAVGADRSRYQVLSTSGAVVDLGVLSKRALARKILDLIEARLGMR